jgi:outer membrane protein assembly factor BamB
MADLQITGVSNVGPPAQQAQVTPTKAAGGSSAPKDELDLTEARDVNTTFWEKSKQLADARAIQRQAPASAFITGNSAGWKAQVLGAGGTNCYAKVPIDDSSVLVIPLQNHGGGAFGKPVVASTDKGIIAFPDVHPFGSSQGLGLAKSAGGERIYLFNQSESTIKIYNRELKEEATIDFSSLDPGYGAVKNLTSTPEADYAFLKPRTLDMDGGYLVALDPVTHAPKWTKKFDSLFSDGIYVGPSGTVFLPITEDIGKPSGSVVHAYAPDGKELGTMRMADRVGDAAFLPDGTVVVNQGRKGVKALAPARVGTLTVEKWALKDKNYCNFQSTSDGSALYAVDPCDGFYRSHILVKLDSRTGAVLWERKAFGEHFIDMRLVNGDLCLITSSEDRQTTHLRKLDSEGNIIWEDSLKTGEIDEYTEGMRECITPRGDFIFGGRQDGNLWFIHPRKQGETEESIQERLDRPKEILDELRESGPETGQDKLTLEIADDGDYLVVDGVKLHKRKE